jgi:hypothetical protein
MEGVSLETIGRPVLATQSEVLGRLRKIRPGLRCRFVTVAKSVAAIAFSNL